jgi:hypothetical protein
VLVLDARVLLDGDHGVVTCGELSRRGYGNLSGIVLESLQQLAEVLVRLVGVDGDHRDIGNGQIENPIIECGFQQSSDFVGSQIGGGTGCPGVPVVGSIETTLGPHGSGSAGLVDNHDLLSKAVLQITRNDPGHLVG